MLNPVILAVDDKKDNLFVLKQLIKENLSECILFTAESAEIGLEIAQESKLDIVLTDVQMPGMNGIDFCRKLKSSPKTADSIVLMLTAHKSKSEFIADALDSGAFDFISKPVDNLELIARINAALRIKKAENDLKRQQDRLEQKVKERTAELEASNEKLRREIEEKEKVENALKESNQRIMTAMEGTDEGLWDLDLKTRELKYDANWARVLGYSAEETTFDADWWKEHIDPNYTQVVEESLNNYLKGKDKYHEVVYRIKTADGKWIWVRRRGIAIDFDSENRPTRLIGTLRDITEKKLAELDVQRLATAIEQVEDGIVITDADAEILYVNPSFEKVTGYDKESVVGLNPRFLKSGVHPDEFYKEMWDTLTKGEVWSGRVINKRKDGTFYDEESTITPIKSSSGEIINFIAVKRDVTKQVKLEQQLRQAQKMEAIGTLAGGIAHDFNNILFAIQGYNSLSIRLLGPDHPVYSHLQKLGQASDRAKELVTQILTFSRHSEQKLKPLLVQPVVKEALNLMRASIPTTIDVRQEISMDGGLIKGDVTQIHQIIVNLATNAYQSMRDKGGTLEVKCHSIDVGFDEASNYRELTTGKYLELIVSDTGSGMSPATMDRIFEPYFSTKKQGEGTGMGLSIVHGIINSYGGRIYAESEEGVGTTFRVLIPEIDAMPSTAETDFDKGVPMVGGSERIIVVDDEEPISDMIKNMLEELGYKVDAYTSSERALQEFAKKPDFYDAVITDMTMPIMTGAALAEKLLKIKPSLPIIICTGYSEKLNEKQAKEIGIREFLLKPVAMQTLALTVKKAIQPSTAA